MGKKLHIISLDIPYPPDYGGMIDVFYKLKALAAADLDITLHCFQYGHRQPANELLKYCSQVHYYHRKTGLAGFHSTLPYIISSRNDKTLLQHLLSDDAPILFEGLHCTFLLNEPSLSNRIKILRAHNIESDYYRELAKNSTSFLKKIYYFLEAGRLLQYENKLQNLNYILAISQADESILQKKYNDTKVLYIPAFHAIDQVSSLTGTGTYCLYHGNLSVAENIQSVRFLVKEVFNDLKVPLIIAGKDPSAEICDLANDHIRIIANPGEADMQTLIQDAQIHVLPSFQQTGLKLKLLHGLFAGRHLISNDLTIEQPLAACIHFAKDAITFKEQISQLMNEPFTGQDMAKRIELLSHFSNAAGAQKITALLP